MDGGKDGASQTPSSFQNNKRAIWPGQADRDANPHSYHLKPHRLRPGSICRPGFVGVQVGQHPRQDAAARRDPAPGVDVAEDGGERMRGVGEVTFRRQITLQAVAGGAKRACPKYEDPPQSRDCYPTFHANRGREGGGKLAFPTHSLVCVFPRPRRCSDKIGGSQFTPCSAPKKNPDCEAAVNRKSE